MQSLTATFKNVTVPAGTPVSFTIAGANSQLRLAATDASGAATVTYVGTLAGTDGIVASGPAGASTLVSNPASITWGAGKHVTLLNLTTSPSGGIAGQSVTLRATLSDLSASPVVPISGATIHFVLGSQSCNGVTDANGLGSCSVTLPTPAQLVLTASYAGSSSFTAASASQGFGMVAAAGALPGPPTIVSATGGEGDITVTFTPPVNNGGSPITSYTAMCTPLGGGTQVSQTGVGSPITVPGLTGGVGYTCTVSATNAAGSGPPSGASNAVTVASVAVQPIPALDRWSEVVLAALITLLALAALRRRPASTNRGKGSGPRPRL
jgi:hypothetical protein